MHSAIQGLAEASQLAGRPVGTRASSLARPLAILRLNAGKRHTYKKFENRIIS